MNAQTYDENPALVAALAKVGTVTVDESVPTGQVDVTLTRRMSTQRAARLAARLRALGMQAR